MATRRPRRPHAPLPIPAGMKEPTNTSDTNTSDTSVCEMADAETAARQVSVDGADSALATHCIALQRFLEQHHLHGWVRGGAERVAEDRYRAWGCCVCGAAWER
jgi:hypothetical protein